MKSEFGCGHVTYLAHIVGQGKVKPIIAKIEAISAFPQPSTKKQVMQKDCLALIFALQHFDGYVSSAGVPIEVFSDHNPLVFIHRMKDKNQHLLRWSLILSEYNLIADCLSRP